MLRECQYGNMGRSFLVADLIQQGNSLILITSFYVIRQKPLKQVLSGGDTICFCLSH